MHPGIYICCAWSVVCEKASMARWEKLRGRDGEEEEKGGRDQKSTYIYTYLYTTQYIYI